MKIGLDTTAAAFAGGLISGIWWPGDWLIGGIAGVIGCYCYLGIRAQLGELFGQIRSAEVSTPP